MREYIDKMLSMVDILGKISKVESFVVIAQSSFRKEKIDDLNGELTEKICIRSFLVPIEQREKVIKKFYFDSFTGNEGQPYFDENGDYNTGETFEIQGVNFEIIVNERRFEGLGLAYYEPTDRLIKYLNLRRKDSYWEDPYTNEIIIRCEGEIINYGWEEHNAWLGVRKDMLRDYLSARKCGLLIVRYAEKALKTPIKLDLEEYQKETEFGRHYFVIIDDPISGEYTYLSRLWESFWIDPASEPKRWRYKTSEFEFGVEFKDEDGESIKFENEERDYFKIISFNPSMFKVFLSEPNNRIKFNTLTTLTLIFADGEYLDGCINKYGQFQTFLGSLAKLSREKQKKLSAFSEPKKADPPAEFINIEFCVELPKTYPIGWTISRCLKDVNRPWIDRFGKSLLLNPDEDKLSECILLGLISRDFRELADVMLEFRKLIIPEYKINEIKSDQHFSYLGKERNYENMKSIAFTCLLFRKHRKDNQEGESYILRVINELRHCESHANKSVEDVLLKFRIPNENPRITFIYILTEFLKFLFAFKELTENVLGVSINAKEEISNPWYQLRIAFEEFSKLLGD